MDTQRNEATRQARAVRQQDRTGRSRLVAFGLAAALGCAAVACGNDVSPGSSSLGTGPPVSVAKEAFCQDLGDVIQAVDQYGRVFVEDRVTVGQLKSGAGALAASQSKVESSAEELADAIAAANVAATLGTGPTTTTTVLATKTADDHIRAIGQAQRKFDEAIGDVDADTPISEAAAEVQAAGFGLEQAYVSLFADAGCLVGDVAATRLVSAYVTGLQEDLTALGFYTAAVDGVYGPDTVAAVRALQTAAGLPVTGVVDPATEAALSRQLADKGEQQALNIAALQGALAAAGFYEGPIDGMWTPELESAVVAYQTAENLPPTGTIDAATLAALLHNNRADDESTTTTAAPGGTTSTSNASTSTTIP